MERWQTNRGRNKNGTTWIDIEPVNAYIWSYTKIISIGTKRGRAWALCVFGGWEGGGRRRIWNWIFNVAKMQGGGGGGGKKKIRFRAHLVARRCVSRYRQSLSPLYSPLYDRDRKKKKNRREKFYFYSVTTLSGEHLLPIFSLPRTAPGITK